MRPAEGASSHEGLLRADCHDVAAGRYSALTDALPEDIEALLAVVRGLFVHCDYLSLYGLDETALATASRETLPLEGRLEKILARDGAAA